MRKLKKIMSALLCLSMVVTSFTVMPEQKANAAEISRGDTDNNNTVDALDLVMLKRTLADKNGDYSVTENEMKNDVNFSSTFTKTDVTFTGDAAVGRKTFTDKKALVINEICAGNTDIVKAPNGKYEDWIELYNGTDKEIDLTGYYLSDNAKKPTKYQFPEGKIGAGEYLTIFASDDLTAFAFSKNGEDCVLSAPDETVIDSVTFGAIDDNLAFGRYTNGSDIWKFVTPTFGKSNDNGAVTNNFSSAPTPEFSNETGFYGDTFDLTITPAENTIVTYTEDFTSPTMTSTQYSAPIFIHNPQTDPIRNANNGDMVYGDDDYVAENEDVPKGVVIRTMTYDLEDGNYGNDVAKTYFVGLDQAEKFASTPVVSIVADDDVFFDYEQGIFVLGKTFDEYYKTNPIPMQSIWEIKGNYSQRGKEWEREIQFDFLENNGTLGFSEKLGARVMGNASRTYQQKSLKFFARSDYGSKNVKYDLFPGLVASGDGETPIQKFNSFILRNGANDADFAKLRDPFIQKLVEGRTFDTQDQRACVVFLNGEYWGVYTLIQDYDDKYVENHYGVPEDEVIIIENGVSVDNGEESDISYYNDLMNFAKSNDLSQEANYEKISQMMDIQNFTEWVCAEIFIANADWMNNSNNQRAWRSRTVDSTNKWMDGKWRWMMYDTEYSLALYGGFDTAVNTDSLRVALQYSPLLKALCNNATYKQYFADTMTDMLANEFNPNNSTSVLADLIVEYQPLMEDNVLRWGPQWILDDVALKGGTPTKEFEANILAIREFLNNRKTYIVTQFQNNLQLTVG